MKSKAVIFGNNSFAEMLKYYIEKYSGIKIYAFSVDRTYIRESSFCGLPVIPVEDTSILFPPDQYDFYVAVGYHQMNTLREDKLKSLCQKGYDLPNFIHPSVSMEEASIGSGNIILENTSIGFHAQIGNGNLIWNSCVISHECTLGNYNYLSPSCALAGRVSIRNNCFLGIHSTIRNDITVDDHTFIGASCYISHDTTPGSVHVPSRSVQLETNSWDLLEKGSV